MNLSVSAPLVRFFADEKEQVAISCPRCGRRRVMDASPYQKQKKVIRVRCRCGEIFLAEIEFRKTFRRRVMLPGEYRRPKTGEWGEILIQDLSLYGLGFSPIKPQAFVPGDLLHLQFTLDDKKRSQVRRKVLVRTIRNDLVGCEFSNDQPPDSDLNFYLLR